MDEVGGALVAIALVLMAVFVPTAFITGISGQFYKQFALTIATSTLISLIVSLTLSPALGALIMRARPQGRPAKRGLRRLAGLGDAFNRGFDRLSGRYSGLTRRLVRMTAVMLVVYAGLVALAAWDLTATPKGFIPAQDQGNLLISISLPPGSSLDRTDAVTARSPAACSPRPGSPTPRSMPGSTPPAARPPPAAGRSTWCSNPSPNATAWG